jgi:hypothetical protein
MRNDFAWDNGNTIVAGLHQMRPSERFVGPALHEMQCASASGLPQM